MNILGKIRESFVTDSLLKGWGGWLVANPAPYFLGDGSLAQLPPEVKVISRTEWARMHWPLSYVDSYRTYAVDQSAESITLLTPQAFNQLPLKTQQALLLGQHKHNRGQIYRWDGVAHFLDQIKDQTLIQRRTITTNSGTFFALDAAVWEKLPKEIQREWLSHFVQAQQAPYDALSISGVRARVGVVSATVERLANQFSAESGPNCFATAIAAITPSPQKSRQISQKWLKQPEFFDQLNEHKFIFSHVSNLSSASNAILVWRAKTGTAQHAIYIIGRGICLNKNSQAWHTPRELALVEDVVNYWEEDGHELELYTTK